MSSNEGRFQEYKNQLEADNRYKILLQAEYEALLALSNHRSGIGHVAGAKADVSTDFYNCWFCSWYCC